MQRLKPITTKDKVLRALQEVQLEGLKEIDRICRKHNIKYSLGGGTCLGQMRHGGFIPWDDDIDIDMTIDNYQKFIKVALSELDTERFFLRCRETDKNYKRSNARLEINYTILGMKSLDRFKKGTGVFVDIFSWNYLPNNKYLRNFCARMLFYNRCILNYKMYHRCAKKIPNKLKTLFTIFARVTPTSLALAVEKIFREKIGSKKTNWIIDDAIINGNHGGYHSKDMDEYTDVKFEGLLVQNKKNPDSHMRTIYGDNYMQWLKPADRISHHQWHRFDLSVYEDRFNLPENYADYLTIKYTPDKLRQMQKVSIEMAKDIIKVCKKHNIRYFVSGLNAYGHAYGVDEYLQYFREPFKISMPRKEYQRFSKVAQEELGSKYFYQDTTTDPEYKYSYARVRLNYTYIREKKVPKFLEEKYNTGFFVSIIPLDNTANNAKERASHYRKIRLLNHFIELKWQKNNLRFFMKKNLKMKIKMVMLLPWTVEKLTKRLNKVQAMYESEKTNYYVDGSGYQLEYKYINKKILGNSKVSKFYNVDMTFPEKTDDYILCVDEATRNKRYETMKKLHYIKENFPKSYTRIAENISPKAIKKIQKKYECCFLNYYDDPDYQLSVLRYDEENNEYLSNEEIIRRNS